MNEIESCQSLLNGMRVPQLQAVLQYFDPSRSLGRKQELVQRISNLLRDKRQQTLVCQRIREITRSTTVSVYGNMRTPFNQYGRGPPNFPQPIRGAVPAYSQAFLSNQLGGNMNSNVPVVVPSRSGGRAEKMVITRLPFFDVVDVVLKMSELTSLNSRTGEVRCIFPFSIPQEWIPAITYRGETSLPRYEVQLRVFAFDQDIEQADDFPPNCSIRIDDQPVMLPPIIPTNKPNAEQKRYSRPVDITPQLQATVNARQHRVEVDWFSDRRTWAMGIWLVHRQNADILLSRMLSKGARRTVEETKKMIAIMLDGDDDNIALDQLKISLLCPLMKTRQKIPARAKTCRHLQCFDLWNFLSMNEKRPSWKCPQCNANAHYDNLIIDQYFMDLLKSVETNVEEVELLRDGNWKVLEVACDTLSDDDDFPDNKSKPMVIDNTPVASASTAKPKKPDADIITLDDSDDETPSITAGSVNSDASSARTPLTTNGTNIPSKSKSGQPKQKQARLDFARGSKSSSRSSSSSSSSSSSDSDDNSSRPNRKVPAARQAPPPRRTTSTVDEADIIVIDSSEDEADTPSSRPAPVSARFSSSTSNGSNSTDSAPQVNGHRHNGHMTNGVPRRNGTRPDLASADTEQSQFHSSLTENIEFEVAEGLTHFINAVFLRDAQASVFSS